MLIIWAHRSLSSLGEGRYSSVRASPPLRATFQFKTIVLKELTQLNLNRQIVENK
jgi:hypothetical protein